MERGEAVAEGSRSSLAIFVASAQEVDAIVSKAVAGGARLTSAARERDGGLYSAYFADPEGNSWEVVFAPRMKTTEDGELLP